MKYDFSCGKHITEVSAPIAEGPPDVVQCFECGEPSKRIWSALPAHYHCQGFHKTDYDKNGDRLEQLGKQYEKTYGEKLPPPAKDVPKNSGEIY